jgi:hypothetical protein
VILCTGSIALMRIGRFSDTAQFGYATQTLNNYLGSGGQSGGFNQFRPILLDFSAAPA